MANRRKISRLMRSQGSSGTGAELAEPKRLRAARRPADARRGTSRSSFRAGKNIFFGRREKRNEKGAFWRGFSAGTKQAFVSIKKTRQKATF
ncbi:hypothetical protein C8F01DRAFT_1258904 [Mycena amicta]|nr:hypothetical protein C8F01DRAFT_1258904 [Mycena amicta]